MTELKAKKSALINKMSTGHHISQVLYGYENAETVQKGKSVPFNIRLRNDDIELLDNIAKKFKVSRAFLISEMLKNDTIEMFDNLEIEDADTLASYADKNIRDEFNIEQSYGDTWFVRTLIPNPSLGNPDNLSLIKKLTNKEKK